MMAAFIMYETRSFIRSLFLWIDHFDAISSGEELELLHCNRFFAAEVPPDQILKLALGELEATALDQRAELLDVHLLRALLLDAIEEALQELVVLGLIREFISVVSIEGPHEFTELVFIDPVWLSIDAICFQIVDKTVIKSLFGRCIVFCMNWSRE